MTHKLTPADLAELKTLEKEINKHYKAGK